MKLFIGLLIGSLVLSIILAIIINLGKFYTIKYPNYPPPGYRIFCNKEKGWYAPQMPFGTLIEEDYLQKPFKTYQSAINRAWEQYNSFPEEPKRKYNWEECK